MSYESNIMSGMTRLDTINTDGVPICRMAGLTAVEIVHRERRVGRYFVQTLSRGNCSLHGVLVVMDTIGWKQDKQSFTQNSKKVLLTVHTELLVVIFKHSSTFSNHFFFSITTKSSVYLHLAMGCTPDARHRPPKRLLKIWLSSSVAVALLVISTPAAKPSNIRFLRNIGWDWVDMSTPAWALRNISFSSSTPENKKWRVCYLVLTWKSAIGN